MQLFTFGKYCTFSDNIFQSKCFFDLPGSLSGKCVCVCSCCIFPSLTLLLFTIILRCHLSHCDQLLVCSVTSLKLCLAPCAQIMAQFTTCLVLAGLSTSQTLGLQGGITLPSLRIKWQLFGKSGFEPQTLESRIFVRSNH